jgi:crotonobetainyl-CoA:carnitine CoA-transferase CaiB-like acyl-CoA transferase
VGDQEAKRAVSGEVAAGSVGGPLEGVLVLDLSRALAGPHAAMMLGDLGARVIKVEEPKGGDDSRSWGPFVGEGAGKSTYFMSANRNKESVAIDLKQPDGRAFLSRLVRRADILVENFRPGVLDRLGFSVDRLRSLNDRLIQLSITGYGHDGPLRDRPGYDQIMQGDGGLMSMTGLGADHVTKIGVPICDVAAGMYGAFGVLAALVERNRTGRGRVVRTSLLAAAVGVHAFQGTRWTVAGEVSVPSGNHHSAIAPYGAFRCADGVIQIAVGSDRLWRAFAAVVGIEPDEDGLRSNADRVSNRTALIERIESVLAAAPAETWLERLASAGIPSGRIRSLDEVYSMEQTLSQGLLIEVDDPTVGRVSLPGPAVRFDGETVRVHAAPPTLGEHTESVRAWLGTVESGAHE